MWTVIRKEWNQFFAGWMGYLTIAVFLLVSGSMIFFVPETNLLDGGYASLDSFFELAPLLLLILVPAITMRSFSDEYRQGTFELLRTLPVNHIQLVVGKFISTLLIVLVALSGTLVYVFSMEYLSLGGMDVGEVLGSYIGLILLTAVYIAIGIYISSITLNALASFMLTAFLCFMSYYVFSFFTTLSIAGENIGYFISLMGVKYHYENISKGYIAWNDLVYFISISSLFIYQSILYISQKKN
ncbi:MAG: gliding motility-associated ABC transporter permease subunit GldF [Chitinophagia bacterium]|jgi:ABC-2 type transport system permease protein|nr:gliding motility-associated ABC transporter permease subunit GldF [Chitinophagia bacterium]